MKRSQYIGLVGIIAVSMVLLSLLRRAASNLQRAIASLFLPLSGVTGSARELANKGALALLPRGELIRQLEQARQASEALRVAAAQHDEVTRENARLRSQLSLPRHHADWTLRLAQVVGRDPANWWRTLQIDRGSRDGVVTNAPVLTPEGLVGRVSEVAFAHSQVVLLGDPNCRVAVMILESKDHGIIAPVSSNPLDPLLVEVGYLARSSQPRPGQLVVTSGLGGVFPKGIAVGQIVSSWSVDYGMYREARVALAVKMNTLEEVWVKLP